MKLLKKKSERLDKNGDPFVDFFLSWSHGSKVYAVRVRPQFYKDIDKLYAVAKEVPSGEPLEKYL